MRALVGLLLVTAAVAQEAELVKLVDLRTSGERRRYAAELAKRSDISLHDWLDAMRAFSHDGGARTGTWRQAVTFPLPQFPGVKTGTARRSFSLHVPETYDPRRPAGLILAAHGSGGRGDDMLGSWSPVADTLGMIVFAPTGQAGGYGFTPAERAEALGALRWARRHFNIDENAIHLTGISRGGHLTWDLGTRFPDRWASLSPMIGGPRLELRQGQNNLRYVENVAHQSIRDLQGENDDPIMIFNLKLAFQRLRKAGAEKAELRLDRNLGHSFRFGDVDWAAFLPSARRDPMPRRVVRLCANGHETRAYWIDVLRTKRRVQETFTPRVDARQWNRLNDNGKRLLLVRAADGRTARIEAVMEARGVFSVRSREVARFRLLLADGMFQPGKAVTVTWNGRKRVKQPRRSKAVALRDFGERFDRTFIPVVEITIP